MAATKSPAGGKGAKQEAMAEMLQGGIADAFMERALARVRADGPVALRCSYYSFFDLCESEGTWPTCYRHGGNCPNATH